MRTLPLVVVGGSAGGIEALLELAVVHADRMGITREDYEQWDIHVRDPQPGLRIDQPLAEVLKRMRQSPHVCWTGFGSPGGVPTGCHYKTPEIKQAWMAAHDALLKSPPPGWYELVREMRGLLGKKPQPVKAPRASVRKPVPVVPTAAPAPAPAVYRVETIRAAKRG